MGIHRVDVEQEGVVSAPVCRAAFRIGHASLDSSLGGGGGEAKITIEFHVWETLTCSNLGLLETEELH